MVQPSEQADRVLDPARAEADRSGHRVGLPDGYHGAAGPLLAGLAVDRGRLEGAVAADLRGSPR